MGHEGTICDLIVSPDGRHLASCGSDGAIIFWDTRRQLVIHEWTVGSPGGARSLAFSSDGRYIVSAGDGATVRVWDVLDGRIPIATLGDVRGDEYLWDCAWSPDGAWIASNSVGRGVFLWNAHKSFACSLVKHSSSASLCSSLRFSPDSRWLAWCAMEETGAEDSQRTCVCYVLDISDSDAFEEPIRAVVWPATSDLHYFRTIAFDTASTRIVIAYQDPEDMRWLIRMWDIATGIDLVLIETHSTRVNDVSFSPDGTTILTASGDKTARIWCAATGRCIWSFEGHHAGVMKAAFSPDGHFIATASSDRTVRLWSTSNGECLEVFDDHEDEVLLVVFSLDGTVLSSGDRDGVLHIRDITSLVGQLRDRKI